MYTAVSRSSGRVIIDGARPNSAGSLLQAAKAMLAKEAGDKFVPQASTKPDGGIIEDIQNTEVANMLFKEASKCK
jgi:hypothetical protein